MVDVYGCAAGVRAVVVHVDFPGIQSFVFRSRTLLDTIGRSRLLEQLTDKHFVRSWPHGRVGRVLASGVGHFSCEIASGDAFGFIGWYTREVAEVSDALTPVVWVDAEGAEGADRVPSASARLRQARHHAPAAMAGEPAWGAVACVVTGGFAETFDRRIDTEMRAVAREVSAADAAARQWHRAQEPELIPPGFSDLFALPTRMDDLGRSTGQSSKVAVVVADLNGVGAHLRQLGASAPQNISTATTALTALLQRWCAHVVEVVTESIEVVDDTPMVRGFPESLQFPLPYSAEAGRWLLPVRPWIGAGDDVVLVCESRIAWSVAAEMIAWLDADAPEGDPRSILQELFGVRLSAAVGVAVVPHGVSLTRAHGIAQKMGASAKAAAKAQAVRSRVPHGLDWHRGVIDPDWVEEVRTRRYPGSGRPMVWSADNADAGFPMFAQQWLGSGDHSLRGAKWATLRSTVRRRLSTAARSGTSMSDSPDDAVAAMMGELNRKRVLRDLPELTLPAMQAGLLLDALDLRDDHLHLAAATRGAAS